MIADVISLLL